MANQDTPVLVGWPIANRLAFVLQAGTPVPYRGQASGDDAEVPADIQPLPAGSGNQGPVWPVSGLR